MSKKQLESHHVSNEFLLQSLCWMEGTLEVVEGFLLWCVSPSRVGTNRPCGCCYDCRHEGTIQDLEHQLGCERSQHSIDNVATPLWAKCEGEAHTPKSGKLESSGTPENLELDCRGQISSHLRVIEVIEKVLKCRCPKWPRIGHLDICSSSYGQKKGRESNWQFDSRSLKLGNRPALNVRWGSATWRWKPLQEGYKFDLDLIPIGGWGEKLRCPKVPGVQNRDSFGTPLWESRDKRPLGCGCDGVA
jgi:hypothetical protein